MSVHFEPIYTFIKETACVDQPNQHLSATDEATQQCFLGLIQKYPFAFSGIDAHPTFSAAVTSLQHTARAMDKDCSNDETLEEFIDNLNTKVARDAFCLLQAIHMEEKAFENVKPQLDGKEFVQCPPILLDALKNDKDMAKRVCLQTGKSTQEVLRGKGDFAAPGFLDQCSPNLVSMDLSSLWIAHVLPSMGRLTHLISLNLSNNPFERLPDEMGNLKNLRILDLSNSSKFKKLPQTISQCASLVELNCSKTKVSDLPEGLATLEHLKIVDMQYTPYNPNKSNVYLPLMTKGVNVKVADRISESTSTSSLEGLTGLLPGMGDEGPSGLPDLLGMLMMSRTLGSISRK